MIAALKSTARLRLLVTAVALLAGIALILQQPNTAKAEGGQAFSISPPLLDVKADPGKTVTAKIKLTNLSQDELTMQAHYNDFGAKNETGEPNIFLDETAQSAAYSLRGWITPIKPFQLKSKETKTLDFAITVPENAEPGAHYAVIRFTGKAPSEQGGSVALNASIGTLVFLQVSGQIAEKATLASFYSTTSKFEKSSFLESGPLGFVTRIKNEGNTHLKPTGTITVTDMFGRKVSTLRVNGDPSDTKNPPKNVLPNSIRRFNQTLDQTWLLGRYTAKLDMTYGGQSQKLNSTITFWIIPYKFIIVTLLMLVGLFFLLRFSIKKYNAHIIRRSRSRL